MVRQVDGVEPQPEAALLPGAVPGPSAHAQQQAAAQRTANHWRQLADEAERIIVTLTADRDAQRALVRAALDRIAELQRAMAAKDDIIAMQREEIRARCDRWQEDEGS